MSVCNSFKVFPNQLRTQSSLWTFSTLCCYNFHFSCETVIVVSQVKMLATFWVMASKI